MVVVSGQIKVFDLWQNLFENIEYTIIKGSNNIHMLRFQIFSST
jgi:hypothetical protein